MGLILSNWVQVLLGKGLHADPVRREIAASEAVSAQLHGNPEQQDSFLLLFGNNIPEDEASRREGNSTEREREREMKAL